MLLKQCFNLVLLEPLTGLKTPTGIQHLLLIFDPINLASSQDFLVWPDFSLEDFPN